MFNRSQSNQVDTVKKVLAVCSLSNELEHEGLVRTSPRSYRLSTENGWKSVPLRNVNRMNQNLLRLKRLFPIEHDLSVLFAFLLLLYFHLTFHQEKLLRRSLLLPEVHVTSG